MFVTPNNEWNSVGGNVPNHHIDKTQPIVETNKSSMNQNDGFGILKE